MNLNGKLITHTHIWNAVDGVRKALNRFESHDRLLESIPIPQSNHKSTCQVSSAADGWMAGSYFSSHITGNQSSSLKHPHSSQFTQQHNHIEKSGLTNWNLCLSFSAGTIWLSAWTILYVSEGERKHNVKLTIHLQ